MVEPHTDSTILHIRSKDCTELTTGFNTHLQVTLAEAIERKIGHKFHLSLSSAEIPYVFYNVSAYLQSNKIRCEGGTEDLFLADGNYDIYDLVTAITAASFPFSMTYNENTMKVTLTNTGGGDRTIDFSAENSRELAKMLGFDRTPVQTVTDGASLVAEGVVNLRPVHSMYLHSDLAASNVFVTRETTDASIENILDKIPLGEVGATQIITYDPYESAPFSTVVDVDSIQDFQISLRDQNRRLIQLNKARYEISLLVQQVLTYNLETDQGAHPYPEVSRGRRSLETKDNLTVTKEIMRGQDDRSTRLNTTNDSQIPQASQVPPLRRTMSRMPPTSIVQPRVVETVKTAVKRPRMDAEHLDKQEIQLQNALLYAASALP